MTAPWIPLSPPSEACRMFILSGGSIRTRARTLLAQRLEELLARGRDAAADDDGLGRERVEKMFPTPTDR
jgi:hypothetical protein